MEALAKLKEHHLKELGFKIGPRTKILDHFSSLVQSAAPILDVQPEVSGIPATLEQLPGPSEEKPPVSFENN